MDALKLEIDRKRKRLLTSNNNIEEVNGVNIIKKKNERKENNEYEEKEESATSEQSLFDPSNSSSSEPDPEINQNKKDEIDKNEEIKDKEEAENKAKIEKEGTSTDNDISFIGKNQKCKISVTETPIHLDSRLTSEQMVYKFFRNTLLEWQSDLDERSDTSKNSYKGKQAIHQFEQTKDHIKPLFRLCKAGQVPVDILESLKNMVRYCEEGKFKDANDEYIKTAIGNSTWPIGLTMVGIHERAGREKINTSNVAHVMNNEFQRKYLTSVKRIITFAQSKRPDVPASMKVLG